MVGVACQSWPCDKLYPEDYHVGRVSLGIGADSRIDHKSCDIYKSFTTFLAEFPPPAVFNPWKEVALVTGGRAGGGRGPGT